MAKVTQAGLESFQSQALALCRLRLPKAGRRVTIPATGG